MVKAMVHRFTQPPERAARPNGHSTESAPAAAPAPAPAAVAVATKIKSAGNGEPAAKPTAAVKPKQAVKKPVAPPPPLKKQAGLLERVWFGGE